MPVTTDTAARTVTETASTAATKYINVEMITDYKLNRGKDANFLPGLSSQDIALSNTISLIYIEKKKF